MVIAPIQRTPKSVRLSLLVDLCLPDREFRHGIDLAINDPDSDDPEPLPLLEVGGRFNGVEIVGDPVDLVDGLRVSVQFRRLPSVVQENLVALAWKETMLGRIRGLLARMRSEGAAYAIVPYDEYHLI